MKLTDEQEKMLRRIATKDGQSEWVSFSTRRHFGYAATQTRQKLKKLGLIARHPLNIRGVWRLTDAGKNWIAEHAV